MIILKMIGWLLLGILTLILLVVLIFLSIDFTMRFNFENDELNLKLGIGFIFFPISTKEDESPKKAHKSKKKNEKIKKGADSVKKKAKEQPEDTSGLLQTLIDLFSAVFPPAGKSVKYLRFRKIKLFVVVSEQDAASTAIRYGQLSAILPASIAAAENICDIKMKSLGIRYDFLMNGTTVAFSGDICLRGIWIVKLVLHSFIRFIKRNLKNSENTS